MTSDEYHFPGTTAEWHYGKQRLKSRCILRRLWKTARDMVPTWLGAANRSKHGQRRPRKLDRRWLTAAYGGQSAMVSRRIVARRRRASQSAGRRSSSAKYEGACSVLTSRAEVRLNGGDAAFPIEKKKTVNDCSPILEVHFYLSYTNCRKLLNFTW